MEFKCKICGGQVRVDRAAGVCICEYCGTKQAIPLFTDDSSKRLYESGNNYLQHCEYDKAENVFNQLLSINPQDAEIYWDLVMCKYGVTFVRDPRTGKYIPTCNRTHYGSVLNDKNYLNALNFSTGDKNAFYRSSGETIDKIQKGIIAVVKKEKPFDIFISYKETDQNGNRTKDSVVAQELYEKLVQAGYKVFFSRITLEDKIGSEYEPYIYAALSSSKVMLTVSSSKENIEAPWVKNEWSRFLTLRQADSSKTIIPLYFSMQKSELPDEFAILSAQDIGKPDYEQDLIRGIKKLIPLPIMLAERRKKRQKRAKIIGITAACVILIAGGVSFPFMKDYFENIGDYNAAMQLYNDKNYEAAIEAFKQLDDFKNSGEMIKNCDYDTAMQLYYDGNYPQAAWAFRDIGNFKDSVDMQKKAELAWRESLATVAISNNRFTSYGSYYITTNGTSKNFYDSPGSALDNVDINEHGKIISISEGKSLYALHEDGYVTNSAVNNQMEADWEDVIQISPLFSSTNVALKSDGTLLIGSVGESNEDEWLNEACTWKNIISISWAINQEGAGSPIQAAMFAALDSNGVVHTLKNNYWGENSSEDYDGYKSNLVKATEYLSLLNNVKSISLYTDYLSNVSVVALDNENNLYSYINGNESTDKNTKPLKAIANCFGSNPAVFIVQKDHTLSKLGQEKTIIEDVVYLDQYFVVTRSGTIFRAYYIENENPEFADAKTDIKNSWMD